MIIQNHLTLNYFCTKLKLFLKSSGGDEEQEQLKSQIFSFDSVLGQLRVGDNEYKLSPKRKWTFKTSLLLFRKWFMPRDLALRKIKKRKLFYRKKYGCLYC